MKPILAIIVSHEFQPQLIGEHVKVVGEAKQNSENEGWFQNYSVKAGEKLYQIRGKFFTGLAKTSNLLFLKNSHWRKEKCKRR